MPHIKNALIRYRIIDKCIRNKYQPYPSKETLRIACEESLYGASDGNNICNSTIEKDMFAMKMEHDAPIKYSKRYGGYYYTNPDFSINDIPLNEDDLSAIRFALNTLTQFREVSLFRQFGNAIDKIVDRVSIASNPQDHILDKFVQFESAVSSGGSEHLNPLLEAVKKSFKVHFSYRSFRSDSAKNRTVLPLMLKEYRNRWYVITHDLDKKEIITYALDRLSELQLTDEVLVRPSDFNQEDYFKFAVGISTHNRSKPQKVVFKAVNIAAKYIDSQPFHSNQTRVEVDATFTTFEMTVLISEELIRAIMSYGGELHVLEPAVLREELIVRLKKMASCYGLSTGL
jgi:predicted DNA-binding transcriptional regulator YafY